MHSSEDKMRACGFFSTLWWQLREMNNSEYNSLSLDCCTSKNENTIKAFLFIYFYSGKTLKKNTQPAHIWLKKKSEIIFVPNKRQEWSQSQNPPPLRESFDASQVAVWLCGNSSTKRQAVAASAATTSCSTYYWECCGTSSSARSSCFRAKGRNHEPLTTNWIGRRWEDTWWLV